MPIVFLDTPGDPFWEHVHELITRQLVPRGLVSASDTALYRVTDSCDEAVAEVTEFYSNYRSIRSVGDDLIIRLRRAPDDAELKVLNRDFAHLVESGTIRRTEPYSVEKRQDDQLDLDRYRPGMIKVELGSLRPEDVGRVLVKLTTAGYRIGIYSEDVWAFA